MNDEQIVATLKSSVGSPPEVPGRIDAIRQRAGRAKQRRLSEAVGSGALAVALIGGLVALNGPGAAALRPKPPVDTLAAAAERTIDTGSFRFEIRYELPPGPERMSDVRLAKSFASTGEVDLPRRRGAFHTTSHDREAEIRVLPTKAYIRYVRSPGPPPLPAGKTWIARDVSEEDLDEFNSSDPSSFLDAIRVEAGKERVVGEETVRGVATQVFELEAKPGTAESDEGESLFGADGKALIYIDGDGLVRRVRLKPWAPKSAVALVVDYFDFGADIEVEEPPAAQVVTEAEAEAYQNSQRDQAVDNEALATHYVRSCVAGHQVTPQTSRYKVRTAVTACIEHELPITVDDVEVNVRGNGFTVLLVVDGSGERTITVEFRD